MPHSDSMKSLFTFLSIPILFITCTSLQESDIKIEGELKQWHKVTLLLEGIETSEWAKENPFLNYRLSVEFTNGTKQYIVPGFYAADGNAAETSADAGGAWKVHFRPDEVGEWNYKIFFKKGKNIAISEDAGTDTGEPVIFDGREGSFTIEASDKTGPDFRSESRIINGGNGYFHKNESGHLFIKNGADSPENFLAYTGFDQTYRYRFGERRSGEANPDAQIHEYAPHISDWNEGDPTWQDGKGKGIIGAVNYLSGMGINSIYMLTMNIQGDGKDVWPYNDHNERYRFDCSKLAQWEIVFDHMEQKGVMIHFVLQETENETLLDNGETNVQRKLYLRELTARYGHHLGISWNMGEENGPTDWSPIGQTDEQRKNMAEYIEYINPYKPLVFLHSHASDAMQDKYLTPLLGYQHLDGASMQIGNPAKIHQRITKWIKESERSGHRWIVNMDEIGPHTKGVLPDSYDAKHDTVRHLALWGSLLGGAGGVEWYFGYKFPHTDLGLEDFRSRHEWWKQSTIATDFIQQFPLETMSNHNNLISMENPSSYCFANPGEVYLVYLPKANKPTRLRINSEKEFAVQWFNPREGGPLQDGTVLEISGNGKGDHAIGQPPSGSDTNNDWVAVISDK